MLPVSSDRGLGILPTCTFETCPPLDLICVPGGGGVVDAIADLETVDFVRRQAARAEYVTSVCTGAFLLGAAGLLNGRRVATHWGYIDLLPLIGARHGKGRGRARRQCLQTGDSVTAGIDFAFSVVAELAGGWDAQGIQPAMEDLKPLGPIDVGHLVELLGRGRHRRYGKGAIVGEAGGSEPASALARPRRLRDARGASAAARAIGSPASKKVGGRRRHARHPAASCRRRLRPRGRFDAFEVPASPTPPSAAGEIVFALAGECRIAGARTPAGRPGRRRPAWRPTARGEPSAAGSPSPALLAPPAALAHATERMVILRSRPGRYMLGAALAVALTALAGARPPRACPASRPMPLFALPRPRRARRQLARRRHRCLALVALGVLGPRDPLGNLLSLTVWTFVAVGLALARWPSATSGPPSTPGPRPATLLRRRLGRTGGLGLARLGHLPAIAGLFGLAWFEIVALGPGRPRGPRPRRPGLLAALPRPRHPRRPGLARHAARP